MPIISAKVSQKELEAIQEYANLCGETMSNLIRKVVIGHATFLGVCILNDPHADYECEIPVPDSIAGTADEDKMVEAKINNIRKILGWTEIKL
jgi:hypothetical protein